MGFNSVFKGLDISIMKFPIKMKKMLHKNYHFFKYCELRTTTVNQLGSSSLEGQKYIMHWLSQLFSIEGKS
jgi:hypothetical protein